jgi:hypothetical protein
LTRSSSATKSREPGAPRWTSSPNDVSAGVSATAISPWWRLKPTIPSRSSFGAMKRVASGVNHPAAFPAGAGECVATPNSAPCHSGVRSIERIFSPDASNRRTTFSPSATKMPSRKWSVWRRSVRYASSPAASSDVMLTMEGLRFIGEWTLLGSNQRPSPCKGDALNQLS